ncbi:hypothetical protein [Schlesneria sp. DSM 10557]|uniref:hypothetical protein n=1 Tax=Schlesneria sp. DSM 10557 TaxID=3044399 RepID=UPI0035A11D02
MTSLRAPNVLGRSLLLEEGDLVLTDGEDGRDFTFVSGRDNLSQGLRVMIGTAFGTDVFNVNYGLDMAAILTTAQTKQAVKDLIRLNLVKSISQDDRITMISEVVFDDDPRYYELMPGEDPNENEIIRRNTRKWLVIVVIQAVIEGEVALRLEGTGLNT